MHLFFLDQVHDFHFDVSLWLLNQVLCGQVGSSQLVSTQFTDALLPRGWGSQDDDLWYWRDKVPNVLLNHVQKHNFMCKLYHNI